MSTVGRATRLRWVAVVTGVAALVGAVMIAPSAARVVDGAIHPLDVVAPQTLIERALASGDVAHSGVAQSRGSLGLPDLPRLSGVPALLGGTTRMRVWWSTPDAWRVDTVTVNGETDTYGVGSRAVVWDFETSTLTMVYHADGVRLPRADDLLPPQAARRILAGLGPEDEIEALPSKWVAGETAAGVRIVPGDARSTISRVDLWVDPVTGLPLDLHIVAANGLDALVSTYLDVDYGPPDDSTLVPPSPRGVHRERTSTPDLAASVNLRSPWLLPDSLAGLGKTSDVIEGTATYGSGLVRFAVLPLPDYLADDIVASATEGGATALDLDGGTGVLITSSVLNAVVVVGYDHEHTYVIAGFVTTDTLLAAANELFLNPPAEALRVIITHDLTKRFGRVVAVDGVNLDVRAGDRYGFLGPNGSGKTTTVRMLLGLVFATSGEIELMGEPMPKRAKSVLPRVGALVEGPAAYGHLSARTNLSLLDASGPSSDVVTGRSRRRRIDEVLEQVGLATVGRRPVRAFSLGMRQRLGIASALIGRPELLILDEPTNGLDPQGIREVRDLLVGLNESGTTIFMSSHLLAEVEQLCTRVGVVDRGRLVAQAPLSELRGETGRALVRVGDPGAAVSLLNGRVVGRSGDELVVAGVSVAELTARLVGAGILVHEAAPERRSLEDAVLALTSHGSDRVDSAASTGTAGGAPGRSSDTERTRGSDIHPDNTGFARPPVDGARVGVDAEHFGAGTDGSGGGRVPAEAPQRWDPPR